MIPAAYFLRVALWVAFILPICARMLIQAGDPLAAGIVALILGALAHRATALPED